MKKFLSMSVALLAVSSVDGHRLSQRHRMMNRVHSAQKEMGIFDKMVELATAEDKVEAEKHEASKRKEQQLIDAEKEHEKLVKEEEEEEEKHQQEIEEQQQ